LGLDFVKPITYTPPVLVEKIKDRKIRDNPPIRGLMRRELGNSTVKI
jgi:hypothetical protein